MDRIGFDNRQQTNLTQSTPGASFSFVESYTGPGLQNHTVIQRSTEIKVTDTTSVFTQ